MVAKKVRDSLPQKLNAQWEVSTKNEDAPREISLNSSSINSEDASFISADDESRVSADLEETDTEPEIFQILKDSFLKAFRMMDRELRVQTSVDCFCSGTTAVTLIKQVCGLISAVPDIIWALGKLNEIDSRYRKSILNFNGGW